jgi:hypothetical protein
VFAEFGSANSDDDGVRVCHSKESCRPYPDFLLPSIESLLKLMWLSAEFRSLLSWRFFHKRFVFATTDCMKRKTNNSKEGSH